MMNVPLDPRSPAEEDPVIHQRLVLLEPFAPRSGFSDRVLLNVWLPLPLYLRRVRQRGRAFLSSKRLRLLAVPFLIGAALTLVSTVVFVATHPHLVAMAWGLLVEQVVLAGWQAAASTLDSLWTSLVAVLDAHSLTGATLAAGAGATVLLWSVCTWGLYRILRTNASQRNVLHAQR